MFSELHVALVESHVMVLEAVTRRDTIDDHVHTHEVRHVQIGRTVTCGSGY
jgi:hypothetical protein